MDRVPAILCCFFALVQTQKLGDIKGPPISQEKEVQKIFQVGDTVRIECPISGHPAPLIEWRKGEEKIDHTWMRIRTVKKLIKIRNVQMSDTGVYFCKGINGFGNTVVKVNLIVLDPSQFPNESVSNIFPPSFTAATRSTKEIYVKQSGDSFRVDCAADGIPQPDIIWLKDGLPFNAEGIWYKNGRSTIQLTNVAQVDTAVYTCLATNIVGTVTKNFTLRVQLPLSEQPLITGNSNVSVLVGQTASLECQVESLGGPPHIKWLKKEDDSIAASNTAVDMNTISVGEDRYRVIHTEEDILLRTGEYLNKLVIHNAVESDSGLYICFLTNSGSSFNYKPMYLRVYPLNNNNNGGGGEPAPIDAEPLYILTIIVILGIMVLFILVAIIVCIVRKTAKAEPPEATHAFLPNSCSTESNATIMTVTSNKFEQPLPPPPSMLWGQSTVKPNMYTSHDITSSTNLLSDRESPDSVNGNQYEVPYCYSVRTLESVHKPVHAGGTVRGGAVAGISNSYGYRQYPYFQYLSDYEPYQ